MLFCVCVRSIRKCFGCDRTVVNSIIGIKKGISHICLQNLVSMFLLVVQVGGVSFSECVVL